MDPCKIGWRDLENTNANDSLKQTHLYGDRRESTDCCTSGRYERDPHLQSGLATACQVPRRSDFVYVAGEMILPSGKVIIPTGKAFDLDFVTTARWDGDLLIEEFALWDSAMQAHQIGLT